MAVIDMPLAEPVSAVFPSIEPLRAWAGRTLRHPLVKVAAIVLAAPVIWLAALGFILVVMACELAPTRPA